MSFEFLQKYGKKYYVPLSLGPNHASRWYWNCKYVKACKKMNFQKNKICVSRFIAQSRCRDTFGRVGITLSSSHLCALSEVGDTCSGDSGGSLIR